MGLLDVLNGMQQGPRGSSTPSGQQSGSNRGMSPLSMAILGLLAWKTIRHLIGGQSTPPHAQAPSPAPTPTPQPTPSSGSANPGDILKSALGGLLGGGAAGTVLSGGLSDLLKQLQDGGHGETANSWVGGGPNKAISPSDLSSALGADQINQLSAQSGMSRDDLLSGLSRYLPQVIDHLTPDGRLPSEDELSGRL
jgi:uncharacterized protein YidB (DUF937 family)